MFCSLMATTSLIASYMFFILQISDTVNAKYVTQHEKTGLMYTKYTALYYSTYLLNYLRY